MRKNYIFEVEIEIYVFVLMDGKESSGMNPYSKH